MKPRVGAMDTVRMEEELLWGFTGHKRKLVIARRRDGTRGQIIWRRNDCRVTPHRGRPLVIFSCSKHF